MTVRELKDALQDMPDDTEVFFDTLSTEFFQKVLDLFGRAAEYMPGNFSKAQYDAESDIVWLQE